MTLRAFGRVESTPGHRQRRLHHQLLPGLGFCSSAASPATTLWHAVRSIEGAACTVSLLPRAPPALSRPRRFTHPSPFLHPPTRGTRSRQHLQAPFTGTSRGPRKNPGAHRDVPSPPYVLHHRRRRKTKIAARIIPSAGVAIQSNPPIINPPSFILPALVRPR